MKLHQCAGGGYCKKRKVPRRPLLALPHPPVEASSPDEGIEGASVGRAKREVTSSSLSSASTMASDEPSSVCRRASAIPHEPKHLGKDRQGAASDRTIFANTSRYLYSNIPYIKARKKKPDP